MGASASFESSQVSVTPGGEDRLRMTVRNTGTVVDQFTFEPIGEAAAWFSFEPPQLSLFPSAEETVEIVIRAPRDSTAKSGAIPFAVKVSSQEDPEGSYVEEGTLHVGGFDGRGAELMPRMSSGSRKGEHQLAIDNTGNTTMAPAIAPYDPDGLLSFEVKPGSVTVEPGQAGFVEVVVRPNETFWRGQPVRKPFQVVLNEEGKEPIAVDGVFLQEPKLPKWFWKALLALLALLILLLVLWWTLLKPSIESTARDSAAEEVAAVQSSVAEIEQRLDEAGIPPAGGGGGGAPATTEPAVETTEPGVATTTTTLVPDTTVAPPTTVEGGTEELFPLGTPTDFRLEVGAAPGATQSAAAAPVPDGQVLSITDFVLQNPTGASGR
nr:hypothetical protein [Ilumatobacteraceae bacterium]